ncbi:MAG TPA: hypothetical protein VHU84_09675 [Lacipirellulaceae bacterium]|nr:hypothetical protein [Lacipirellulaceae bacterium]
MTHQCLLFAFTTGAGSKYTAMAPPDYSGLSAIDVIKIFAVLLAVIGVLVFALSRIGTKPGRPPKLHK